MTKNRSQVTAPVVVLLGAGHPYRGTPPSALQETPDHRRVLDWIVDAFSRLSVDLHFVGGYQLKEIVRSYPGMSYAINTDWETTGAVASLFAAPLSPNRIHYVAYTDVVFRSEIVQRLSEAPGDIVLAVDRDWRHRYQRRRPEDMRRAEKVHLDGDRVTAIGVSLPRQDGDAEFCGLLKLSPRAVARVSELRSDSRARFLRAGLPDLLSLLIEEDLRCTFVDVENRWAELNAPQDLARFILGTKAETLERLRPLLRRAQIGEQVGFTVASWRAHPEHQLERIVERFGGTEVVVRSSALSEDSWSTANAGSFLSLTHVPGGDGQRLRAAVDEVVASFSDGTPDNQVLVQEMLTDLELSGVAFTRSLTSGAPYYVVNYDDVTGSTASVTGGTGRHLKTLVAHRKARLLPRNAHPRLGDLLEALAELESLVGHDSLDVEFAISRDGRIHVLQVRPIAVDHSQWRVSDALVDEMLAAAEQDFRERQRRASFALGRRTLFGVMPDWNPAEIIGTKPRRLATSLYRYLVTEEVWATERAEFGYRDVRPCELMTCFLGHPYIDVRASFSSFVPQSLPEPLAERLVEAYLDRLEHHPELHDKVEFEVVLTCLTLDFGRHAEHLKHAGLGTEEIEALRSALRVVTRHALERYEIDRAQVATLEKRRARLSRGDDVPPLALACALLDDARRYGTLPFAHLARGAFVATALLRSAVAEGILSEEELSDFMSSLQTVARRFGEDGADVAEGRLSWKDYRERYGHLRPGTYEITSPCYAEDPERYLRAMTTAGRPEPKSREPFCWSASTSRSLLDRLHAMGIVDETCEMGGLDRFFRRTIEGREYAKFAFTRNLSDALEHIARYGETLGLSRDQLSHVTFEDLTAISAGMAPSDVRAWLEHRAEEGERWHLLTQAVELPPLILRPEDVHAFIYPESRPNFVTRGTVVADLVDLTDAAGQEDLNGRIALIPQADPGYDWIFGQRVVGLVTMYGGANSHMAIRAAEFGLPAAIGVGESLYRHLRHAKVLQLDCAGRRLQVLT